MPDSLVRNKIKEALIAAGNNRHDAHKLLLTWAVRDPALLLSMTKPHLKAIATGLIDHHLRSKENDEDGLDGEGHLRTAIDDIVASANKLPTKDKRKNTGLPPPKSTERQASTMRRLAAAFTRKKK